MERYDYYSKEVDTRREVDRTETASCSKCGRIVNSMHLAPAFITICRECYVRENPHIDDF
jgi:formylmethanofuran dehydrogenase subunit E